MNFNIAHTFKEKTDEKKTDMIKSQTKLKLLICTNNLNSITKYQ